MTDWKNREEWNAYQREKQATWRARNREKVRADQKAWHQAHPGYARRKEAEFYEKNKQTILADARARRASDTEWWVTKKHRAVCREHRITIAQFASMMEAQKGRCAICKNEFKSRRDQSIDHDHATQKVRGILCHNCNLLLGHAKDNVATLRSAIRYLTRSSKCLF